MASEWPLGAGSYTCPCWLSNRNRARTQAEVHDVSRNLPAFADHDFSSHIQEAINHQVRRRKQFKSHIVCKLITRLVTLQAFWNHPPAQTRRKLTSQVCDCAAFLVLGQWSQAHLAQHVPAKRARRPSITATARAPATQTLQNSLPHVARGRKIGRSIF